VAEYTNVLDKILVIISVTSLVMVIPGPDMILVMRNTLVRGRGAGLQTSVGILSGNMIHITYCVLGLGLIISKSIVVYSTLKYAGAAYLVYLGVMSIRAGAQSLDTNDVDDRLSRTWFVQGCVNNLLNPKGALFYLSVFTVVITPETSAGGALLLILCMLLVSALFWLLFVYGLDRPIVRTSLERSQRSVNRIFGALLVLLGVRVAAMSR
jgi:RhtB (resistance to homoserine/threonine) family protein